MGSLLEFDSDETITREAAAERLRTLADHLARHNDVEFVRDGQRYVVDVADRVRFELELELDDDENELEITVSW